MIWLPPWPGWSQPCLINQQRAAGISPNPYPRPIPHGPTSGPGRHEVESFAVPLTLHALRKRNAWSKIRKQLLQPSVQREAF